jgi:hypothetical protein
MKPTGVCHQREQRPVQSIGAREKRAIEQQGRTGREGEEVVPFGDRADRARGEQRARGFRRRHAV